MAVTYCTANEVAEFLQFKNTADSDKHTFTAGSKPTLTEVEAIINRVEDYIDNVTGHAWRTRYSGTRSGQDTTQRYEYYDIDNFYEQGVGYTVNLKHRMITTLATDDGDVVEVWNGNSYDDYTADKTLGRANDYWLDQEEGNLYLKSCSSFGKKTLRIKYRYGDSNVAEDISNAAIHLTAAQILQADEKSLVVPEGADRITLDERVRYLKGQGNKLLATHMEFSVV